MKRLNTTPELIKKSAITLNRLEKLEKIVLSPDNDDFDSRHVERWFSFVTNSQEIQETLNMIGFPARYQHDITGILAYCTNREYNAIWLTEYSSPESIWSVYHPLPYYRNRIPTYYPCYWQWDNEYYQL